MKRYLTFDDIIDVYSRLNQRGSQFLLSKLTLDQKKRTQSAFDPTAIHSSNWWMIPMVKERWNLKLSHKSDQNYRQFMMEAFFNDQKDLKLLSLGSGSCAHELELAAYPQFQEITCVDLAQNRLKEAEEEAQLLGLDNMKFVCADIDHFNFKESYYDIVLFNSSLHHFANVEEFLCKRIKKTLKSDGYIVVNEFVGATRLQFPNDQIKAIREAIQMIDRKYRKRFKTNFYKNSFYGSGLIRMKMADPSECIDSSSILPALHQHFITKTEIQLGGNILMNALKDIAHHFINPDEEAIQILKKLFAFEDAYLQKHPSDFIFGIYQNRRL
jgi:ubiquinone/menaquinone biosynthesis C-methylase UbiE